MPCYCDIPSESDQVEIEKRCKEKMYFDATSILNKENLDIATSKGIKILHVPFPDPNTALCNICKVLSEEQMKSIDAFYYQIKWDYKNLFEWYTQHCKDDKNNSEGMYANG